MLLHLERQVAFTPLRLPIEVKQASIREDVLNNPRLAIAWKLQIIRSFDKCHSFSIASLWNGNCFYMVYTNKREEFLEHLEDVEKQVSGLEWGGMSNHEIRLLVAKIKRMKELLRETVIWED